MLKFIFWTLLAANAALFAYREGYLGPSGAEEHEPARLRNQIGGERLVLLTGAEARAVAAGNAPAQEPQQEPQAATPAAQIACIQAGPFSGADARRFESRLRRLDLPAPAARVDIPFQEVTSRLVYLPPNGGREGAQRRAAELKERGVSNFFIMQGDSPLRWAISLGVFKTEGAAQKLAADLGRQGVRGVRVLGRGPQTTRAAFQYRSLDAATRARIAGIAGGFSGAAVQNCN